ncbi:hypothetical protein ACTJI8_18325 [Microbacterium sp. 22303]|uniref:hypothetical protein n=1 Tax=Microbacterium sp. 22303 TaxID=3453905 RepID=UPI003F86C5E3
MTSANEVAESSEISLSKAGLHELGDELVVAVWAADGDAEREICAALVSYQDVWAGVRSALVSSEHWAKRLQHTIQVPRGVAYVAIGKISSLMLAARRKSSDTDESLSKPLASRVPDDVRVWSVTWEARSTTEIVIGRMRGAGVAVRLRSAPMALDRHSLRAPATWENSDLFSRLAKAVDLDVVDVAPLSYGVFRFVAFAAPIAIVLGVITWSFDFAIATGVAGIGLGFALHVPWMRYAKAVTAHLRQAKEQRLGPWRWLTKRLSYVLFGIAFEKTRAGRETYLLAEYSAYVKTALGYEGEDPIRPYRRGGRVRVRRPAYFADRFVVRRLLVWRDGAIEPVHGAVPPRFVISIRGHRSMARLARSAARLKIRIAGRLLRKYGSCDRESVDTFERFMNHARFVGRDAYLGQFMTAAQSGVMMSALLGARTSPIDTSFQRTAPVTSATVIPARHMSETSEADTGSTTEGEA